MVAVASYLIPLQPINSLFDRGASVISIDKKKYALEKTLLFSLTLPNISGYDGNIEMELYGSSAVVKNESIKYEEGHSDCLTSL